MLVTLQNPARTSDAGVKRSVRGSGFSLAYRPNPSATIEKQHLIDSRADKNAKRSSSIALTIKMLIR
jgi:hypothetical protein